jgi:biopolymer transport protein ExbB/TolQ
VSLTYNGWYFLAEMWNRVSPLAECTAMLLVFMFVWALVEGLARGASYGAAVWQSRGFLRITQRLLENGDWDDVLAAARLRKRSHVATVFAGGLLEFRKARECVSEEVAIEAAKRGARIATNCVHEHLRQGLSALGTIATTAPFVGFFGSVVGIADAFKGSAVSRATLLTNTANSIAEALVCSAMGMLVAIPTVWCFNLLRERLSIFDAEMEITSLELVKYLELRSRVTEL